MGSLQLLDSVVRDGQTVVDGVKPDQLGAPTPCEEFDVRALLNHLTVATTLIADGVNLKPMDPEVMKADLVGDDAATAFRQASKSLLESWNAPGVLERNVLMPFGEVDAAAGLAFSCLELYTHIADAAVATGQEDALDPATSEGVLGVAAAMPIDNFRMPGVFGPAVECADGAPAHRRLLALLGRAV